MSIHKYSHPSRLGRRVSTTSSQFEPDLSAPAYPLAVTHVPSGPENSRQDQRRHILQLYSPVWTQEALRGAIRSLLNHWKKMASDSFKSSGHRDDGKRSVVNNEPQKGGKQTNKQTNKTLKLWLLSERSRHTIHRSIRVINNISSSPQIMT